MKNERNTLKRVIRDKEGSTYLDIVMGIVIACLFIALLMKVVPCLFLKYQLNTLATNASRVISIEGCYSQEVIDKLEEYKQSGKLGAAKISLDGTQFISGTDKIQLNDLIVVHVSMDYDLGFFRFGSFIVTLNNKAEARSEVYWKE